MVDSYKEVDDVKSELQKLRFEIDDHAGGIISREALARAIEAILFLKGKANDYEVLREHISFYGIQVCPGLDGGCQVCLEDGNTSKNSNSSPPRIAPAEAEATCGKCGQRYYPIANFNHCPHNNKFFSDEAADGR